MDAYLNEVVRYLVAQSWQIALLTLAVAVATFALRHRSAHVRYLLWLIVLAKCLVPPLQMVPLRVLPQTVPPVVPSLLAPPAWSGEHPGLLDPAPVGIPSPQRPEPPATVPQPSGQNLSLSGWLGLAWIAGAGVYLLMNLLRALRGDHWLRKTRRPLPADVEADMASLLRAYTIRRPPRIWIMAGVGQPFVWGLPRGNIYVPPGFLRIESPAHRRDILAHELSHVLRFDAAVNSLQVIAQAIFWFHPFVWWANCRIRREREKCCDEMAIAHLDAKPKDYSSAIVTTLIQAQEAVRAVPSLAVAGPVKNIEERIKTMLRPGKRFYKRPSLVAATMVLLAALLTVPTALVLTAQAQIETLKPQTQSLPPLHEAARAGDIEKVKTLLASGANVNEKENGTRRTALHYAAEKGHLDVAALLVSRGADVNASSWNAMTPLHCAAASGNKETVELLLNKGASLEAKQRYSQTPVLTAMKSAAPGRREVVTLLVTRGAKVPALHLAAYMADRAKLKDYLQGEGDMNAQADDGSTVLHAAACSGSKDIVEFLLGRGATVDAKDTADMTPLYYAARHNSPEIMDLLLAKGANINAKDEDGFTLLYYAIWDESKDGVKLLISKGANINARDSAYGHSPLEFAIWDGNKDIVELVIAGGADVNAEDKEGKTPLYWAALEGRKDLVELLTAKGAAPVSAIHLAARMGDLAKVKSLVEAGAAVNARNKGGQTPLFPAVLADNTDVAQFLMAQGADVNATDKTGQTAMHGACDIGCRNGVELLVAKGANVNARDDEGRTPLYAALFSGRMDIAGLLIAQGADVNAKNTGSPFPRMVGMTPLHLAAGGSAETVRLLLAKGADINARTGEGATPLHIACRRGEKDVVELLINRGADLNIRDSKGQTALSLAKEFADKELAETLRVHGATE